MKDESSEQEKLKAAIENIVKENLYLYVLEIDYQTKEIIVCITEKLLWNLVPVNPKAFQGFLYFFSGYEISEVDDRVARHYGDRNSVLSKN